MASWRDYAIDHIFQGLLEYEAQCLLLGEAIDPEACRKWLNKKRYPFGVREYSPYSIWCEETKRSLLFWQCYSQAQYYKAWRTSIRAPQQGKKLAKAAEANGQMTLAINCKIGID